MTLIGAGIFGGAATIGTILYHKITHPYSEIRKIIDAAFEAAGLLDHHKNKTAIPWVYKRVTRKDQQTEVIMRLPRTKTVLDVQRVNEKLALAFDCGIDIQQNGFGFIKLIIYKDPLPTDIPFDEDLLEMSRTKWIFPVGKDRNGWAFWNVIHTPHMLFAGLTNTGKTMLVISITACVILNHPESTIYIYDGKGDGDFNQFSYLPQVKPIAYSPTEADNLFKAVIQEMRTRSKKLRESGCKNIEVYNEFYPHDKLNRIFVFIDEIAQLPANIQKSLSRILQLGRSKGIHVAVGTQRPDRNVLNTQVKSQCDARCCFRQASEVDSRIVLDDSGAEVLPGIKGRFIYSENGIKRIMQAPYANEARLKLLFLTNNVRKKAMEQFVPLPDLASEDEFDFDEELDFIEIDEQDEFGQ